MKLFPCGHATHPQWRMAANLVLAQLQAQMAFPDYASQPRLGLLYITDHFASDAQDLLDHLRQALPLSLIHTPSPRDRTRPRMPSSA